MTTNPIVFEFAKVRDVKSPNRATPLSAGIDFFVPEDFGYYQLEPGEDVLIPSGIKAKFTEQFMLLGIDKSGIASSTYAKIVAGMKDPAEHDEKPSIIVGAKLVDADYQGEIHIHLINTGNASYWIEAGMKIAQFVLVPVAYPTCKEVSSGELYSGTTERGDGGFGSTN